MKQDRQRQNGFTTIEGIIVAVIVLALVFTGWWVWQGNKSDKDPDDPKTSDGTKGQENQNQQEEAPQIPKDFQLYENKDFGFSFGYPKQLGSLTPSGTNGNSSILLYVQSGDVKDAFAPNTQSPLYVRIDKADGFLVRGGKYGPILEYDNGKWLVSSKDGGDLLNGGRTVGSEHKATIARSVQGTPVYDFSFTDEGCHRTVWVFHLEAAFTTITLPAVCADEIDAIPQERLMNYRGVSDQVLETLTIN